MRRYGLAATALMLVALTLADGCSSRSDTSHPNSLEPTLSETTSPTVTNTAEPTGAVDSPTATDEPFSTLLSVQFVNDQVGWASGYNGRDYSSGFILATTDGGQTWEQQYSLSQPIGDLDFVSAQVGWATLLSAQHLNVTALLGTTDGGATWQQIYAAQPLTGIDFISITTGWAVADDKLLTTEDGGRSWAEVSSPPIARGTAVCFADADHGWLASGNAVFRTVDGGQNWTATQTISASVNTVDLQCAVPDVAWSLFFGGAGGMHVDYVLYRTADDGANWTPLLQQSHFQTLPGQPGPGIAPGPLAVVDGMTAYFVGTCPACNEIGTADVEATTDGGENWSTAFTLPAVTEASGMSCPDSKHCWVVGSGPTATTRHGAIAVTADGGQTWSAQYP